MARVSFLGGAKSVSGSMYLFEHGPHRALVDCGLFQGERFCDERNYEPFPFDPKTVEAVFVTHAHFDHTGRLPKLYKEGFRGRIFSTPPTRDFTQILLEDSEHLLHKEAMRDGHKPIWNHNDLWGTMRQFVLVKYNEKIKVGPDITATFYDAGHILGSAFVVFEFGNERIAFSGDLGNPPVLMLNPTEPLPDVSYVTVESTYGDKQHEPLENRREILEDIVEEAFSAGGVLMIPAFAIERTQELLFELNELVEGKKIPHVPVFLDSPLAIKATGVYEKHTDFMSSLAKNIMQGGDRLFQFPGLRSTLTTEESKTINDVPPPKIVIAGAGMSNGGRILHHERRYLPDPKSTLLLIGYQAKGTLGRQILDGQKEVKIFDEKVPVRCKVKFIGGFSSHPDKYQILDWLDPRRTVLKKVFVVHGEEEAASALAALIQDRLAVEAEAPEEGAVREL